jgi:general stress protein 26
MATARELEDKLWKALESDMTVMLSVVGAENGHSRPMTAQIEDRQGPLWFFTASDTAIAGLLSEGARAGALAFASKGHDVFASIDGELRIETDRAAVDRLWNVMVAAWFEGGKDDPKVTLLRFDPGEAQIWENGSSLMAGVKALLGVDPKKDYQKQVATVRLD